MCAANAEHSDDDGDDDDDDDDYDDDDGFDGSHINKSKSCNFKSKQNYSVELSRYSFKICIIQMGQQ